MSLSGHQHHEIQEALLAAFDEAGLRRMVKVELNTDLDHVAGGKNLTEYVDSLIDWADRAGRVDELITAARQQRPENAVFITLEQSLTTWHISPPAPADTSPYKGLEFYDVADAPHFFGREEVTAELTEYLKDHYFLAVVGASGSGKSSVVRAGIVASLHQGEKIQGSERWIIHIIQPGTHPIKTLAAVLTQESEPVSAQAALMDDMRSDARSLDLFATRLATRAGTPRVVIVVDQFEELFTLCRDKDERRAFVDNLVTAATEKCVLTVVITLRADFYDNCAEFDNLRLLLQSCQRYIGPLKENELRDAIEKPAIQGGWDLEEGLTNRLLQEVANQPGALPLLSHVLLETWKRRNGHMLTLAGYQASGGVQGAIGKTADAVYQELTPEQQLLVRNIFVRLTALGEGDQDTRRRVPLDELTGTERGAQVAVMLTRLANARLITTQKQQPAEDGNPPPDTVFVEVAHEALIRHWLLLRLWLNEDREGLRTHRRLTEAAEEWAGTNPDASLLFSGSRLAHTAEWAKNHDTDLNGQERDFLIASRKQAVKSRNVKRVVVGAVIGSLLITLAALASAYSFNQQRLDQLEVEELLVSARDKRVQLDVEGSIANFNAAAQEAVKRGKAIDVSAEISDTLRYIATVYVQEGERILCDVRKPNAAELQHADLPLQPSSPLATTPIESPLPIPGASRQVDTPAGQVLCAPQINEGVVHQLGDVRIQPPYLTWARDTAPQITGWTSYTSTVEQQAIISATALFSQALALDPPPDTPVFAWIPPGRFKMGSTVKEVDDAITLCMSLDPACTPEDFKDEMPPHSVLLDGYWMQRTEVTNRQYKRCVDAGGCTVPSNYFWAQSRSENWPVAYVNWDQAAAYAAWIGGRLPTEAEWEKACRGTDGRTYPWGNEAPAMWHLNFDYQVNGVTEVGTYPAGANGLYDMAGNVWEWTADWHSADYKASPARNPPGPKEGTGRTLRGGSYFNYLNFVRCAGRSLVSPDTWVNALGFRVVVP